MTEDKSTPTAGLKPMLEGYQYRDWESDVEGTVRFALIGLGWWTTEEVLPSIEQLEHCEVTVAVSGSTEKAQNVVEDV